MTTCYSYASNYTMFASGMKNWSFPAYYDPYLIIYNKSTYQWEEVDTHKVYISSMAENKNGVIIAVGSTDNNTGDPYTKGNGRIMKMKDGDHELHEVSSTEIDNGYYGVVSSSTGYFYAVGGKAIYKSTDDGDTWKSVGNAEIDGNLKSITIFDNNIIAVGDHGQVEYSKTDADYFIKSKFEYSVVFP